jgi:hypothetical protein
VVPYVAISKLSWQERILQKYSFSQELHTDEVFWDYGSAGVEVISLPYQAPNASAYAVRTVRGECLDKLLVIDKQTSDR